MSGSLTADFKGTPSGPARHFPQDPRLTVRSVHAVIVVET